MAEEEGYSAAVDDSGEVVVDPEQSTEEQRETEAQGAEHAEEQKGEEAATSTDDEPKDKPKGGVQKRIDELVAQRYEAEGKARQAEQQNEAMRRQLADMQGRSWQQHHIAQKPAYENFATTEEYEQAIGQWTAAGYQMQAQAQQQQHQKQQQQQVQMQKSADVDQKMTEAVTRYPDFREVVQNPNVPSLAGLNPAAFEALSESENMADVAYFLASNPAELFAFRQMSPTQGVRKIAQLEIKTKQDFQQRGKSPPPPPPSTVQGKSKTRKNPDDMSDAEYERAWRAAEV